MSQISQEEEVTEEGNSPEKFLILFVWELKFFFCQSKMRSSGKTGNS